MPLFDWFQALIAAYLVYSAIRGKGQLFENAYTKCPYETYLKGMRIVCLIGGLVMLAVSVLFIVMPTLHEGVLGWVLWGLGLLAVIAIFVYNIKMTDRKAAAAAQKQAASAVRQKDPLRAAFVFDDEEENDAEPQDAKDTREKQEDREQNGNA